MTTAEGQQKLVSAIMALKKWQAQQDAAKANRHGRCLEAVRFALGEVGMKLPAPMPAPNNLAISNYKSLVPQAKEYGWQPTAEKTERYCLNFYSGLGWVDGHGAIPGRYAGHIAIYDSESGILYSSVDYNNDAYWEQHHVGSFLPLAAVEAKPISASDGAGKAVTVAAVKLFAKDGTLLQHYQGPIKAHVDGPSNILVCSNE